MAADATPAGPRRRRALARWPWANTVLLALLVLAAGTGFLSLLGGSPDSAVVLWAHGAVAYGIIVVLAAKAAIVLGAVRRRPGLTQERLTFLLMAALLLFTLGSGLVWAFAGPSYLGAISLINWHAYAAILMSALLAGHLRARSFGFRVPAAQGRGAFLRLVGVTVAGGVLLAGGRAVQALLDLPGARRRFTGSYERGGDGNAFPEVSWLNDDPAPVDVSAYRLVVDGAVERPLELRHAELRRLARDGREATLDCTGGWYARRRWEGVELGRLLDRAGLTGGAASVTVESVTGYARRFPLGEARGLLLATAVAGEPLSHGHGAPARLVAPDRRGFDWVKWVVRVHVNEHGAAWQPPLPLS